MNVTGKITQQKPKKGKRSKDRFGAIYGGHYSLSDHWGSDEPDHYGYSFEGIFREVDMEVLAPLKELRAWVNSVGRAAPAISSQYRQNSASRLNWGSQDYLKVLKWALSVHLRSPAFRRKHSINFASKHWSKRQQEADGAENVRHFFQQLNDIAWPPQGSVSFSCLRSGTAELLFGDHIEQNLIKGRMRLVRKDQGFVLRLDGFIELALFPDVLLRINVDPFGPPRIEMKLEDAEAATIVASNKAVFSMSEEVFFRDSSAIADLGDLKEQSGVSGKRHLGKGQ